MRLTFIFKNDQWKVLKIFPSEIEEEITTQTFEVPLEILPKLEAIKTLEYQDNCENISFDIYYLNGKYTGIHNTRVSINHKQYRFSGTLNFTEEELGILESLI